MTWASLFQVVGAGSCALWLTLTVGYVWDLVGGTS